MENYRKLEHIAHGRYMKVYNARNLTIGKLVTVKEFNSNGHKFGLREKLSSLYRTGIANGGQHTLWPLISGPWGPSLLRCILGIPSATERRLVPGVGRFEWSSFEDLQTIPGRPLAAAVPRLGPQGLDLLAQMLEFVPQHRISGLEALSHPYFKGLDFDN
ncbi:hypothetical protein M0R45_002937 [Rubus argutus]|uniref:Uncharacterized protein n=1 Tax=Rubus argutus TaxID=59490 RepID=A0AAW1YGL1_RUBAR